MSYYNGDAYRKLALLLNRNKYEAEFDWVDGNRVVCVTSFMGKKFEQNVLDGMAESILEKIQYQLWKLDQEHLMPTELSMWSLVPLKLSTDDPDEEYYADIYISNVPASFNQVCFGDE